MAPVSLSIIGYGIMGERLLRAALDHDPAVVTVAGVWDPSPVAMARLREGLPQVRHLASPDEAVAACDCLYVASPPSSHLEHAERGFAAGKAVFCEKPLSVDVTAGRAFAAGVAARKERAAVNFPFTSSFAVDQIRQWMTDGTVGNPTGVTVEIGFANWPRPWQVDAAAWLDATPQGGFTREVVSHFLFLTGRLLGPVTLGAHTVSYPEAGKSERAITAELTAGSLGISLTGTVGKTDKPDHNLWIIEGENGAVRLRDWAIAERRMPDGSWQEAPDAMPNEKARPLVLRRQLDQVAALTRGEPQKLASIAEALAVQEIVETILKG
jgi:predicted dehydrogenase